MKLCETPTELTASNVNINHTDAKKDQKPQHKPQNTHSGSFLGLPDEAFDTEDEEGYDSEIEGFSQDGSEQRGSH